jgi:DNA processing protein
MNIQGEFLPKRLRKVSPPIEGLWYRGNTKLVRHEKIVAIVGSRKMSAYGKQVLSEIVPRLVEMGYVTVSGFMYGVDIEMHRLTIEHGGQTIGVFGWGIDAPIIPENEYLYHKVIESNGLFLSELSPNQLGTLWTFPARNRIVVGLSDIVIVVEAGIKSGSLNSADWARKMGKPVYAVPGSIFSSVSEGCNWLLSQGLAKPLTLDFFEPKKYSKKVRIRRHSHLLSNAESMLVTHLRLEGPQSLNELSRSMTQPVSEVSALLTQLLLLGEVREIRGLWSPR